MVTKPGQIPGEQTSNGGSEQRLRDVNEKVVPSSAPERELIEKLEIAEKKLSFLGLVVASSAESIVTVDFGGVITTWNKSAERLYGYPADEAVGKPLTMLTLPEDLLEILSNIDSIKHGEAVEIYDTVRIRKSGDHIDLEILMSPVTSADGHIIGVATIARDITERVRAESERENSRIAEKEQKASELAAVRLSETQLAESQTRLALELAAVQHLQEEQTRAQEMLRLSEGQLQALLDQTPMGVYLVDADFRIVAVNPTAMPVFAGIPDLIGRDFDEVIHRLWSEEYADEVVRLFRHTLETGEPYYTPERIEERRDLGVAEYYEWQISRIPLPDARDGVVCYFRDVSAQVFARLNLAASEEKYRTLFESIDEGFCLIDLLFDEAGEAYDYVFLEANAAFERQSGLVGVVGRSILELVPGFDAQWVKLYGLVAKTGESRRFEADVASMARVYDVYAFSSGENKVAAVFNDITERKRSEANLAFLAEVSNDLVRFTTIDETINALGAKIARHFRASLCSFLDIDAERGIGTILHEWRAEDAISLIGEYRIADYGSEEQLATWRSGEPFVVRDVESDERVNAEALAPFGIGSYLSIPIARDGEWRYLLTVYDRAARDWREDEVHLMSELTSRIWTRLERARAEAALLVREARQAFLLKLSDALRPIADPLEIQAVAMRVLGEYLGNIGAQYYESDDDGEHFNSFGGYTDGSVAIVERVRLDDFGAFTKEAYRAGRTLVVNDVPHDDRITPEQADAYKAIGVYAYVGVPLIKAGRLVVALGAVTSAAHAWTKDEIALIEETAQRTWAAVERARAEAALLESETRYRALVTVGSSTIYRMSPDWREMFQLDGAGFVADTEGPTTDWIETYLPPDERPRVEEAIARAIRTKDVFELEHRVKRVDGTVGWTLSRAIPLLDDAGEIKEWFGVASDVTARVKADQSFTRLFEASPAPFLVLAPDAPRFTITEVNDAYLTATMRTREELVGRPLFDAFPDNPNEPAINGVSTLRASLEDVLASHRPNALPSLKFDIARPDGTFEERWWSPVNSPILDENGDVEAIIHNANDVTEQRHADAMLRESEERYRTLFNTIDQGYATAEVIFDESCKAVDLVYLETNAAFEELTGVKNAAGRSAGQIIPGLGEFWCETYGKVILTGESVRFENYVEGLNKWFDVFASRIGGEDSRKVALVFSNITDRKKAEQSIRFQAHLLNTVEQSAIATDLDGTVTYWNQFAEKLYGWTAEEAVGRQISELTTPDIMANQAAEIMSQLRRGISWAGEFNVKRRDGTVFPAYVINSPIETEAGELVGIIGISVDITERKRVEEELLRSRESLERRVEERTRELAKMNAALHTENVERRKIEAERVGILQRLVTSQEDVRRRLGRDLHDQLGQQVTALRFRLEALAELTSNNPELKEQVRHAQDYAKRVDADVGFFAFELRPTALDDLGLAAAIDIFVNEWSRNHKISAEFYARPFEETLPPETKINVYRIVQEALNNIFKHAKAKSVTVHLDLQKDTLVLIITDDGIGFDLEKKKINIGSGSGLGLIGMRERCILVGGNLEIETAPGKGTVIFARVPA